MPIQLHPGCAIGNATPCHWRLGVTRYHSHVYPGVARLLCCHTVLPDTYHVETNVGVEKPLQRCVQIGEIGVKEILVDGRHQQNACQLCVQKEMWRRFMFKIGYKMTWS